MFHTLVYEGKIRGKAQNVEIAYLTIKLLCEIDQKMPYRHILLIVLTAESLKHYSRFQTNVCKDNKLSKSIIYATKLI